MATVQQQTEVIGREEREQSVIKRISGFWIFKTTWWELVSSKHVGNDLHIRTERDIRQVYLNGKPLIK